jgi:hypothetical protein
MPCRRGPCPAGCADARRRTDRRDVIEDRLEHGGVVDVGGGDGRGQRQPTTVADQVELAPGLATIDGICAHLVPPRLARTLMVSTLARDQSSRPCSPSRSRTSRCKASNTPAFAHSVRRRQQVAGEPQPSSRAGSSRHGVEVRARTRSRQSSCDLRWCGAGRRTAGEAAPAATAPPAPTAGPAPGHQQGQSWRGILPYPHQGAKRRLSKESERSASAWHTLATNRPDHDLLGHALQ